MRRVLGLALATTVAAVLASACSTTAELPFGSNGATPTPSASGSLTPTPAISPTIDPDRTITGPETVTDCTQVTDAPAGNTVDVADASFLGLHDEVFLLQAQAPQPRATPTNATPSATGDLAAIAGATLGYHQFALVMGISGQTLTLSTNHDVALATTGQGAAELCRVPVYDRLEIAGSLRASPWNGTTGGVVVVEAKTLILGGSIDATGAGFRAGAKATSAPSTCVDSVPQSAFGGGKGEGDAPSWYVGGSFYSSGYATEGLGGGGGNPCGLGGGGGGNGGAGGHGGIGNGPRNGTNGTHYGDGGLAFGATARARPTFGGGGGGGAGTVSSNATIFDGAAGGGLVWIRVPADGSLSGTGSIFASGANAPNNGTMNASVEGFGGGGAGGTIVLEIAGTLDFSGQIIADGGNGGGDQASSSHQNGVDSPGGGGGGGRISVPAALSTQTSISGGAVNNVTASTFAQVGDPGSRELVP